MGDERVCGDVILGPDGVRRVCVRDLHHRGDHGALSGARWPYKKAQHESRARTIAEVKAVEDKERRHVLRALATMPGLDPCEEAVKAAEARRAAKDAIPLTMEDVIANIKDRLSVDVRVSRTDYEDSSNTVRVTLKWDNVAFSETSDTIPAE